VKHLSAFALLASCAGVLAWPPAASAHSGGVDANGCHYERSTGKNWQDTYHCHEQKPADPDTGTAVKKSRENSATTPAGLTTASCSSAPRAAADPTSTEP